MSASTVSLQPPDSSKVQRLTRQIDQVSEMMARMSGSNVLAADFFQALTARTLSVVDGPAGAVWLKSPRGELLIQHQSNMGAVGLNDNGEARQTHGLILQHAFASKQLVFLPPEANIVLPDGAERRNFSPYPLVVAPILSDRGDIFGLFEIWLDAACDAQIRGAHVSFVSHMAGYATNYLRNTTALRNSAQEQIFTQLETFSRQIHASLNPTEVAFLVANEGRRLIGCDRVSVGVRYGRHTTIEAVSGSESVENSSVQVKALRDLFDAVLDWNVKLVYRGERDATLPPLVLEALDVYLEQSNPKLLVLQPLHDEREVVKDKEKESVPGPARSAMLMEMFEPPETSDPMTERFAIVAGHAAPALYNAAEMKRIPFALLWKPIMALQSRAGGRKRFYTMLGLGLFTIFMLAMFFVPYPLKLDAKGQLEPEEWNSIFPAGPGRIVQFKVTPGQMIRPNAPIAVLYDYDLGKEIDDKIIEIRNTDAAITQLSALASDQRLPEAKRKEKADEKAREQQRLDSLNKQINLILEQRRADPNNPGYFTVYSPEFPRSRNASGPAAWKVVSADFNRQLVNRYVRPTDPLLRVGNTAGAWQIEMKIPQKHSGQMLRAFKTDDPNEYLEVDVLVTSAPTKTFKGRLYHRDISAEAVPNKDDHNESEFVVYAYARVNDPDMPKEDHIPPELLVSGVEVHTKIRCGNHSLGYSLFHGAWEFVYEHVIFFF